MAFQQMQVDDQLVVDRQMFFDQLDDTLATINSYLKVVKKGHATTPKGQVLSSLCGTSLNCFSLSSNERHSVKDKKSLILASHKLQKWIQKQKLTKQNFDAIAPMLKFIHCCIQKKIDVQTQHIGTIDDPSAYGDNFNQKNVSYGASQYLNSNHVIKNKVKKYKDNFQEIDQNHNKKLKQFGGKGTKIFKDNNIPTSDDIYHTSIKNPKYRDFNKVQVNVDVDDDYVMDQTQNDNQTGSNHNHNHNHNHARGRGNYGGSINQRGRGGGGGNQTGSNYNHNHNHATGRGNYGGTINQRGRGRGGGSNQRGRGGGNTTVNKSKKWYNF